MRPQFRDIIIKIPKVRGYRLKSPRAKRAIVNIGELEAKVNSGEKVTPELLVKLGLVSKKSGKISPVKLLGSGTLTKNLLVKDCQVSGSARKKIEEAGGKIL